MAQCYLSNIQRVKITVSLSAADVAMLDEYARSSGLGKRSAVLHYAIRRLYNERLEDDYAAAWAEWDFSGERAAWEGAVGDGLSDAPR